VLDVWSPISELRRVLVTPRDCGERDMLTRWFGSPVIETAWVILTCAGGWLGYSTLSMTAGVSTALKPDQ
jgi:hypothetical protein